MTIEEKVAAILARNRDIADIKYPCVVRDADCVLSDAMDEVDFDISGIAEELLMLWESTTDKDSFKKLFNLFTDLTFEEFLDKCIDETAVMSPANFRRFEDVTDELVSAKLHMLFLAFAMEHLSELPLKEPLSERGVTDADAFRKAVETVKAEFKQRLTAIANDSAFNEDYLIDKVAEANTAVDNTNISTFGITDENGKQLATLGELYEAVDTMASKYDTVFYAMVSKDNGGGEFFNECALPAELSTLLSKYVDVEAKDDRCIITATSGKAYEVGNVLLTLYDLSDEGIVFVSDEDAQAFVAEHGVWCKPFDTLHYNGEGWQ